MQESNYKYFSESSSSTSIFFPKNSFRTFISGNSLMSKIHISTVTDSFEKILQDDMIYLDTILSGYNQIVIEESKKLYFNISTLYHELKIKKSKNKLYCYVIYKVFVKYNIQDPQDKIANMMTINKKKVCDALKEIELFLRFQGSSKPVETPINFYQIINKIYNNYDCIDKEKMTNIIEKKYNKYKKELENNHKVQSVLAGIIYFCFIKEYQYFEIFKNKISFRKYLANILNITESTIKIVYSKLEKS